MAPYLISLFRHLGASPTAINFNEVYSALQTGIVDGQENPLVLIDTAKLYEVQKYCSLTNHVWAGFHTSFNVAAWKRLPPDLQETVAHASSTRRRWPSAHDCVTMTKTEQQNLTAKGLTFNAPDTKPFREVLAKSRLLPRHEEDSGRQGLGAAGEICRPADVVSLDAPDLAAESPHADRAAAGPALRRSALRLDHAIGAAARSIGAALVLAEVCILFAGVVSRYVLRQPAVLDRRARELPVPVAGDARHGRRAARATAICG